MNEGSPAKPRQETELWWGGYSPWAMLPSLLFCFLLTGLIVWWGWTYVERRNVQLAILSLTGIVWITQTIRFAHRIFGNNYHLTTRRVIHDWGINWKGIRIVPLSEVESITVERSSLEEFLGVGRVVLRVRNGPPMVWKGVRHSTDVAERVRAALGK